MSNLLEIHNLKKYFHIGKDLDLHAVDGVSFNIEKGHTLGIVGESGCGKSTLGRTVIKLHEPTDGNIFFDGEDITKYNKKQMAQLRSDMQMIFQDPYSSINPRMTVQSLIAEPIIINNVVKSKSEAYDMVDSLMETVGLAPRLVNAYPHELDGGRRQRIGIARALALNPRFIVCDEPVSALDVSIQAQVLNLLMDLQEERDLTYMFITHNMSVVKHISDEIAVMYLGQCVEKCDSKELFKNPLHPYTKALLSAIPVPSLEARNRKLEVIKGEVTSPVNPKPGCRFATRCPFATEECKEKEIQFEEKSSGHFVACCKI